MSSSEDEAVRRPGRQGNGGRAHGDDLSNEEDDANMSGEEVEQANDNNDDKDLFGSDSEADLDEYVSVHLSSHLKTKNSHRLNDISDGLIELLMTQILTLATMRDATIV